VSTISWCLLYKLKWLCWKKLVQRNFGICCNPCFHQPHQLTDWWWK
jgi:hypothetical protein